MTALYNELKFKEMLQKNYTDFEIASYFAVSEKTVRVWKKKIHN